MRRAPAEFWFPRELPFVDLASEHRFEFADDTRVLRYGREGRQKNQNAADVKAVIHVLIGAVTGQPIRKSRVFQWRNSDLIFCAGLETSLTLLRSPTCCRPNALEFTAEMFVARYPRSEDS